MKKALQRHILLVICLFLVTQPVYSAEEYLIKASFIFNFFKFVKWQTPESHGTNAEFMVCVVSNGAIPRGLKSINNKEVHGKVISMQAYTADKMASCQVIYILADHPQALVDVLPLVSDRAVLTIGEHKTFIAQNGIINLLIEGNKMRFEINRTAALKVGISISAKLLQLAKRVY